MAKKVKAEKKPLLKIEREQLIWDLSVNKHWSNKEIIEEYGEEANISDAVIKYVLKKLSKYPTKKAVMEYFKMADILKNYLIDFNADPDTYLGKIMSALYVKEISTETKFKRLTEDELDEFFYCKQMRHAGSVCWDVLSEYWMDLRS